MLCTHKDTWSLLASVKRYGIGHTQCTLCFECAVLTGRRESAGSVCSGALANGRGPAAPRGELMQGCAPACLCRLWDSAAALNMAVIFNLRRNAAEGRPPRLQCFPSVRTGNVQEPHFLVTWCSSVRRMEGVGGGGARVGPGWLAVSQISPTLTPLATALWGPRQGTLF